ncbi:virB8 family protein [Photobacterium damselae]|uniref:virB8 family protein n=2 Tax=Photobacterium damselae TaxID=38293 RepID=UPI004067FC58
MFKKKTKTDTKKAKTSAQIDEDILAQSLSFEASMIEQQNKSERRAWQIASVSVVLVVLLIIAITLMMPLKRVELTVATVDRQTGHVEIQTGFDSEQTLTKNEALDGYFVARYINWHEGYQWQTLQENVDNVALFSTEAVYSDYEKIMMGDDSLQTKWGNRIEAKVDILSIRFNETKPIATVRFKKTISYVNGSEATKPTIWIATLGFDYFLDEKLTLAERYKNPLNFKVTAWRLDPELIRSK